MMNEFTFDPSDPPAGIVVADPAILVDHRVHGESITAVYDYEFGRRVTLECNGVVLEFHQGFNPDFRNWFEANDEPMMWRCIAGPEGIAAVRAGWDVMQPAPEPEEEPTDG